MPSGISRTSAISRYSISCKSRRITASRKSGDSFCSVACRISLASRPASAWSGRQAPAARLLQNRQLVFDGIRDPLLTCSAIVIDQKVTRDPRQPGAETAFGAAKGLDRLENTQENFLRQILRFLRAVRKTEAEAVHLPRVLADELLPGGFIATQASRNEAMVQTFDQVAASGNP